MDNMLGKLKKFTDQGYGIILGECGVVKGYKDKYSRLHDLSLYTV